MERGWGKVDALQSSHRFMTSGEPKPVTAASRLDCTWIGAVEMSHRMRCGLVLREITCLLLDYQPRVKHRVRVEACVEPCQVGVDGFLLLLPLGLSGFLSIRPSQP